ncbi:MULTISPECIES: hypothetical protein [unclassified Pseudomonas]|uniref:hypothetical protein n=1 Tax=unclassified Pseudomonas TaxID=196821 RepID=UPI000876153B|nr:MULTISPECIES: hypothetical protein [unclassified Pseudomonas]SCZ28202.1 hypothetical protein SAMN03159405_02026 [Pseudomonas sp. NFACC44-2]SDA76263.1 hypothetical protein SAMN03159429_03647 [Pseudomonas sp. NFACC51]SEJ28775.1 hypothetical protein SAMN03159298_02654 [Pseudomonas sp. NFACC07-1]SFH45908.1 hypothetical protein SAMN03159302_01642 [Pseudomonas sp. NFACC54]SFT14445.1 hypothetical protein SAMN03159306_03963 [Pseudomonas sp. NFACC48-1]
MSQLQGVVDDARECARLFRLGRDVEAGLAMVVLIESAQPLVESMPGDVPSSWNTLLALMLGDQQAQNWISLADYLEYEWVQLLTAGQSF